MTCEPRTLVLYHTEGCHLCEQAEALLQPFALARGWRLERVADLQAVFAAIVCVRVKVKEGIEVRATLPNEQTEKQADSPNSDPDPARHG